MTTAVLAPLADARPADGGVPARRAVVRWAWRLFRREWRQQFLILALITVAVAATIVGSAVATNNPPLKNAGFGTARDSVSFTSYNAHTASVIASLRQRFSRVELIENETQSIPGSIDTYQIRAQEARGPFGGPMLSLVSGHYPSGADQVAVTSGVASAFHLRVGATWRVAGAARQVVGIVENPQSLLDEFALVAPGQVESPTGVTALFDAPGVKLSSFGKGYQVQTPASVAQSNPFNPETVSLAASARPGSAHADGGHGRGARLPRCTPRGGGRLHRHVLRGRQTTWVGSRPTSCSLARYAPRWCNPIPTARYPRSSFGA